jgi:hypothetical protein
VITDGFPDVTVLFADAVDFTRRSERIAPSRWSRCSTTSFGNAYMVVGGLPEPRPDHAEAVAEMAWRCWRKEVAGRSDLSGQPLQVRIGIDTGPVMAGVIGTSRFSYDLWATPQYGQPHGVPRGPWLHPGDGPGLPAPPRPVSVPATGTMAVPSRSLDRCKGGGPIVPANGPRPPLRDPSGRRARDQGRTTRPSF